MKSPASSTNSYNKLWAILIFVVVLRLFSMLVFPLTDTTEARYGEIARKMLETSNWVTPLHDYGIPFWAKPPLSTWSSAISMKMLGVNEFAARLPSLFYMLGVIWLIYHLAKTRYHKDYALFTSVMLFTFPMFYITSGAVMTDASLTFSVILAFVTFWLSINHNSPTKNNCYGYLFFISLGIGMLAKGPVSLVLIIPPITAWQLLQGDWKRLWNSLPIVKGTLIAVIITLPWYILAEYKTPGFLEYFIVGEHLNRFLVSGWTGDHYGYAHHEPFGMIWLFTFVSVLPWSLVIISWSIKKLKNSGFSELTNLNKDAWLIYLICWIIWPLLFFSIARNIIITYVITVLPPLALLITECCFKNKDQSLKSNKWLLPALLAPACLISAVMIMGGCKLDLTVDKSQKLLVKKYLELKSSDQSQLYYYPSRVFSAEFYTNGVAKNTTDSKDIEKLMSNSTQDFIAMKKSKSLPANIAEHFVVVGTYGRYVLLREVG